MRKKTGEITLCIDFKNMNKVSLKDNYPLPKMDHILQRVVEASRMSLLDGYFGYNHILVHEDDRDKTTFTTLWETFHYSKMPFGLKNVGATFQRAMGIAFENEKDVFLVVYLDDLIVFSNSNEDHLYHLKIVFHRCRKYGIFLNPKKSLFAMDEGKLLGHIISKEGIHIDPARVEAIQKIDFPRSKKEIQAFNGKMNFLHRFVPNLAEHLREITNMLKKDSVVKWTEEAIKSFNLVKLAISSTPILISLDYSQDFILFSFTSEHTMVAVLMQKRDQLEKPFAFFSRTIRDAALKYNIIEKQALALVKAVKYFQVYILHSHILSYVPNTAVKDVLVQTDPEGRQGKWIATLLEYDLEINPTKLIKGQGLAKLMAESNLHALDINLIVAMSEEDEDNSLVQVSEIFIHSPWYSDIVYVLQNLSLPLGMAKNKSRTLKLKAAKFCIMSNAFYWKDTGGMLLNCLVEEEVKQVMDDFHKEDCAGHLFWKTTTNKILRVGYNWPTLFADVYKTVTSYHESQIFQGRRILQPLPLKSVEVSALFQQWRLDFIGEIHPTFSAQHKWILIVTDYFTKWIEAIPTWMIDFCNKYQITLGHSTAYYPQGNGLAESSNKSFVNIIKKLLETNKKSWHKKLVNALWADRVSQKKSIGMSPFELVYGVDTVFPTSLAIPVVKLLQEASSEEDHF
eukprot:PITA_28204